MQPQLSPLETSLKVEHFRVTYPDRIKPACQIESLSLKAGQCLVLCGPSGSGKSTFLNALNGLIPDHYPAKVEGQLYLGSQKLGHLGVEELSYLVSSVFQNPATQFFHSKVLHELVFPCENQGLAPGEIARRLKEVTDCFGLEDLLEKDIRDLSGGQKQLVAVATALMQGTEVMVFDEPTANLDQDGVSALRQALLTLKAQGKTLIIAEHRLAYLTDLADSYAYFDDGFLVQQFTAEQFLPLSDQERQEMGLRSLNLSPYHKKIHQLAQTFRSDSEGLTFSNLSIQIDKGQSYALADFQVAAGQVAGLIGKNGAGKTSFARTLLGLDKAKSGEISWQGKQFSPKERLQKTAYVMQEVQKQLICESVRKELVLGQQNTNLDSEFLRLFRLSDLLDCHPMSLSVGEEQRVMIVASLLTDKDIFIFDEPSSGLDLEQMQQLAQQLELLKHKGKLIFLISHDEELLARVCDKVIDLEKMKKGFEK